MASEPLDAALPPKPEPQNCDRLVLTNRKQKKSTYGKELVWADLNLVFR